MAMKLPESDKFTEAVIAELTVLRGKGTRELVPRLDGQNTLPSKLVLRLRRHADGSTS